MGVKRRSQAEREELIRKIRAGRLQGIQHADLMMALDLPSSTYFRLVDELSNRMHAQNLRVGTRQLAEYEARMEDAYYEARKKFKETGEFQYISAAVSIINMKFDRLQSAGYINKSRKGEDLSGQRSFAEMLREAQRNVERDRAAEKATLATRNIDSVQQSSDM